MERLANLIGTRPSQVEAGVSNLILQHCSMVLSKQTTLFPDNFSMKECFTKLIVWMRLTFYLRSRLRSPKQHRKQEGSRHVTRTLSSISVMFMTK